MKVALSNKRLLVELTDSGEAFKVVEGLLSDLPDGLVRVEGDVRRDDDVVHWREVLATKSDKTFLLQPRFENLTSSNLKKFASGV